MRTNLHFLTIAEAASLIAARKLSPVELTDAYLERIATLDHQLASFVTVTADRARREARSAEADIMASGPRGKLHGIPDRLKDIYDTAGIRTTAQSRLLADNVPAKDSLCQMKLAEAGAVLLGKNATWEFAHGGPSWDVLFPPARNPWNTDYSPAGSSSGSAAAVAAGLSPATMGSDTGGSIRARRGLRHRGAEADLWPRQPPRRDPQLLLARPCRPARLVQRGRRAADAGRCWARSIGLRIDPRARA